MSRCIRRYGTTPLAGAYNRVSPHVTELGHHAERFHSGT
jgi:hypothetical protein